MPSFLLPVLNRFGKLASNLSVTASDQKREKLKYCSCLSQRKPQEDIRSVWCIQGEVSLFCQSHSKWEVSTGKSGAVCEQDRLLLQIWSCQVLCNTPLHQQDWQLLDCCTMNLNSAVIALLKSKCIYSYTNIGRQQWDYWRMGKLVVSGGWRKE